jgi:hypothetical protein
LTFMCILEGNVTLPLGTKRISVNEAVETRYRKEIERMASSPERSLSTFRHQDTKRE